MSTPNAGPPVSLAPHFLRRRPGPGEHLRLGAIDVGTNSIRLLVAEAMADGSYRILDDEKAITRLGKGFSDEGLLQPEPMERSAVAIERMRSIADGYHVHALRVIGTAAVREARNGAEFVKLVRARAGVELEPISEADEARFAYLSVEHAFNLGGLSAAIVDVGGGSTEIVFANQGLVEQVHSMPLGAVRLTERFGACEGESNEWFERLRRHIRRTLRSEVGKPPFAPAVIFGTGGTFTSTASVSMHRGVSASGSDLLPFNVRGYEMNRSEVKHLLDWLRKMPVRQRARVPGLSPDRAEIIVAGLAIVETVMKELGVNALRVHDRGIRDGLILTMIRDLIPGAAPAAGASRDKIRAARQFGVTCRYEELHSNHVARLALEIFDQARRSPTINRGGWANDEARELLEAAAVLHDVGYFINYSKHHKHSYHLIIHSDLAGFNQRELGIVANVARYHRRAEPKLKHPGFAKLAEADRSLVRRLAAVLRIADGLDRTHTQNITSVSLRLKSRTAVFTVQARSDPAVDIWGAERKSRLFAKVFGIEPAIRWAAPIVEGPGPMTPQPMPETEGLARLTAEVTPETLSGGGG
ncbi:MAG: Ppx/GppA family phosphatase [Phycisphaerales bacterium]|nr:Ppx/GppA family phosphatase [Phycisphaerales bacterium]